jgi:hypothetical protein
MKIIDNFLEEDDFVRIQSLMLSDKFTWNYSIVDERSYAIDDYHFSHVFNPEDNFFGLTIPFIDKIQEHSNVRKIIKVKANLQPRTNKNIIQSFHTDFPIDWKNKTAVYYLNTCNGYTLFADETKVESIANRFVMFDGHLEHTGVTCTDEPARFVINFNWYDC